MGRREAGGDQGAMSTSERRELESLRGIASSGDGCSSVATNGANAGAARRRPERSGSCPPARPAQPQEVKKHQHKHNLKHRYEVLETLGRGTYGKVKKATERSSGTTVAIKSIRKECITDDLDKIHIQREIEIVSSLRHPNIIRIYEVFESKDKIVIVMEYAKGGELYDYVNTKRRLSETEARKIFRQITSAVHYCHKNGVVHRDLKLENILLDEDFNVKLADFGLSNHHRKGELLQTYCGSPLYASPEIIKGLPYHGPEVDCWALGVLLYALVYGSMPFDGASYSVLTEQISQARYRRPQPPSDACALIDWMLTVNVEERATVEDIANHWWVNWGFQEPVCDCTTSQDCPSPLLARYIDWQNRALCGTGHTCSKPSTSEVQLYFSFPISQTAAKPGGTACIKKSRKENTISQPNTCSAIPPTSNPKKPKGILKTQSSFDSAFLPQRAAGETPSYSAEGPANGRTANSHTLPTRCQPSSKMPKKGILKKVYERESGYSSSPERGDVPEDTGCSTTLSEQEGPARPEVVRRRKGILKRNGKFSSSLDLSEHAASLHFSESLEGLLLSSGGSSAMAEGQPPPQQKGVRAQSRPSSVISDDSLLSSDSFDLLDLSSHSRQQFFSPESHHSVYSSEEELEDQKSCKEKRATSKQEERDELLQKAQESSGHI
ncbi:NUAK family SNF1-like kinase 1-like [Scleropages formosus]|uniref:non-specific serine/threonine protein kinase n=1 Tax=Scleropages formosus TaxID=113540 RepID=A0A0P7YW14_SCLFO|nr:NUAK family SNF1-like kinase 1 [Scleropages formosus]KPP72286.1 NUAK family SNF1-like kinase 1-like [Scleropages formosus]